MSAAAKPRVGVARDASAAQPDAAGPKTHPPQPRGRRAFSGGEWSRRWLTELAMSGNMVTTQNKLIRVALEKKDPESIILLCVDVVLRGISQVFLCNHPVTGVFVCAGLAATSVNLMWYALLATAVSTTAAALLGRPPREDVLAGLCGYDGALVGCACWAYLPPSYSLQAAFLLPVLAGLVHVAFANFLRTWELPCFTFAFNVVTIMFLYASSSGAIELQLQDAAPAQHTSHWNQMSVSFVVDASIRGVGQFMFADTTVGSALVVAGICLSSRKGAAAALVGATTGWITARYILHAAATDNIRAGLFGYNCAGTCAALSGGVFYKTSDGTLLIGVVGALLASLLTVGFSGLLGGLPVLTFPFIVSTWIVMLSRTKWLSHAHEIVRPLARALSTKNMGKSRLFPSWKPSLKIGKFIAPVRRAAKLLPETGAMARAASDLASKMADPEQQQKEMDDEDIESVTKIPAQDAVEVFRVEDV